MEIFVSNASQSALIKYETEMDFDSRSQKLYPVNSSGVCKQFVQFSRFNTDSLNVS